MRISDWSSDVCSSDLADGILDLALGLVGLAFGFQLGIAGQLAGAFLQAALDLLGGAFDAIVVHDVSPGSVHAVKGWHADVTLGPSCRFLPILSSNLCELT